MPTEAKDIFEANSKNVRELLSDRGLGLYIPPYQRPYGWDKEKVGKLIEDTLHGLGELIRSDESFTFLGTVITIHDRDYKTVQPIVRDEVPGRVLTVIDGQQRLTTLLLWCVALHTHIQVGLARHMRGKDQAALSAFDNWLRLQAERLLSELKPTFVEEHSYGDQRQYPRMIRSFDDQWSRTAGRARYQSPIARFIAEYVDEARPEGEFKPAKREGRIEGEDALIDRYNQISRLVKDLAAGKVREELEEIPELGEVLRANGFQQSLLNHTFPKEVNDYLNGEPLPGYVGLLKVVLMACYVLNRVAVTVVRGKNEDYAFTVFESLNTTGEPLTAFETFKPRVVSAEGLERYEQSKSREHMVEISDYLAGFKPGDPLQDATRDLLIYFANAETGEKLSKRLADQRKYLKDEFERHEAVEAARLGFVSHLRDTALFVQHAWSPKEGPPALHMLPVACSTDSVRLCLRFLSDLGHSVVIGPLVRFYSEAMKCTDGAEKLEKAADFEKALLAATAFSVLWRGSRRGTANIDQVYREVMQGVNNVGVTPPLARIRAKRREDEVSIPECSVTKFKAELRARIAHSEQGALPDRDTWIRDAMLIPAYSNNAIVTRFLLLAAYHDSVADPASPGLIMPGREAVSPCLTFEGWTAETHLSLEHVAPRTRTDQWRADLYQDKETIHKIGNLVLLQREANASLSNRSWSEKSILYRALGAGSKEEARRILEDAEVAGVQFAATTQDLVEMSRHMPHLVALGGYDQPEWTKEFIDRRSSVLLGMAWDRLHKWLE